MQVREQLRGWATFSVPLQVTQLGDVRTKDLESSHSTQPSPFAEEKPKGQKGDAMAIAAAEQGLNPKADDFDFSAPAFVPPGFLSSQAR